MPSASSRTESVLIEVTVPTVPKAWLLAGAEDAATGGGGAGVGVGAVDDPGVRAGLAEAQG